MTQIPINQFKQALQKKQHQLGLWATLSNPYSAEIIARAGFDWLLFDMEHSPSEIGTVLGQLQAAAPYPVPPVVRTTCKDAGQQNRLLDSGAETRLIPYVAAAAEAAHAEDAIRLPAHAIRGDS